MHSIEKLQSLYDSELLNELTSLEQARKAIRSNYIKAIIAFLVAGVCAFCVSNEVLLSVAVPLMLAALGYIVYVLVKSRRNVKQFKADFKRQVVQKIIQFIDPTWKYYPQNAISKSDYTKSELFLKSFDKYKGDDLIEGKIEKTDFKCSELHTQYIKKTKDKEEVITIFKGLFFHADFNKNFSGKTFISTDHTGKILGSMIGDFFEQFTRNEDLVKLENPEFEKAFVVHSTDQIEARYILTPKIMERVINFKNTVGVPVVFSFVGSRVYCAISFKTALFEPKIFRSNINFDDVKQMYELFKINEIIIQELNLNTRIWTKA
jgi:hypothetical protein